MLLIEIGMAIISENKNRPGGQPVGGLFDHGWSNQQFRIQPVRNLKPAIKDCAQLHEQDRQNKMTMIVLNNTALVD